MAELARQAAETGATLATLTAGYASLTSEVAALKQDKAALATRVDDLEAAAAASTGSNSGASSSDLAAVKADLASLAANHTGDMAAVQTSVETLAADHAADMAALLSDVTELNSTVIANDVVEQEDGTFLAGTSLCAILGPQILALGGDPAKPCVLPTELDSVNLASVYGQEGSKNNHAPYAWISWAPLLIAVTKVKGSVYIENQKELKSLASLFPRLEEVEGTIRINHNADLVSIAGAFPSLRKVLGDTSVFMSYNPKLTSVGTGDNQAFASMAPNSMKQLSFRGYQSNDDGKAFCQSAKGTFCSLGASYGTNDGLYDAKKCCQ